MLVIPILLLYCLCRYEPKDVEVRLATSSNHSLRGPIITRNLPKAAGWVSLFDRQRDMSEHQESLQVSRGQPLVQFQGRGRENPPCRQS